MKIEVSLISTYRINWVFTLTSIQNLPGAVNKALYDLRTKILPARPTRPFTIEERTGGILHAFHSESIRSSNSKLQTPCERNSIVILFLLTKSRFFLVANPQTLSLKSHKQELGKVTNVTLEWLETRAWESHERELGKATSVSLEGPRA